MLIKQICQQLPFVTAKLLIRTIALILAPIVNEKKAALMQRLPLRLNLFRTALLFILVCLQLAFLWFGQADCKQTSAVILP